ncbi:MAG: Crp/Fnr family transcriptional regulator [Halomonas sp.]|nr:Crp/Fnr family transcriptional regulator [Halomonas sp.]
MVKRFGAHCALKDTDIALLQALATSESREVKAGDILWRTGETADALLILQQGWACTTRYLQDGSRQVQEIFLPGDILGLYELAFGDRRDDATMLTDGIVSELPHHQVLEIFSRSPRMTAVLFAISNQHQAILAERLVVLARRSARERIAHFLCECRARLLATEEADADGFLLPLTQQDLADALGLSAVHISRTFTSLAEEGLVQRNHFHLMIRDPERLAEVANFDGSYLRVYWEECDEPAAPSSLSPPIEAG